jgi:hypothetical protein
MTYQLGLFNDGILHIDDYDSKMHKNHVTCRTCGSSMIAKRGEINAHHYAHDKSECSVKRDSDGKTSWHLLFQNIAKSEHLERIIKKDNTTHIADIIDTNGVVIEIQHSQLSHNNISDRETFYGSMIWVLDGTTKVDRMTLCVNKYLETTDGKYTVIKTTKKSWSLFTKKTYIDCGDNEYMLEVLQRFGGGFYLCKNIKYDLFLKTYYNQILKNDVNDTVRTIKEYHMKNNKPYTYKCCVNCSSISGMSHDTSLEYNVDKNEFSGSGTRIIENVLEDWGYRHSYDKKVWKIFTKEDIDEYNEYVEQQKKIEEKVKKQEALKRRKENERIEWENMKRIELERLAELRKKEKKHILRNNDERIERFKKWKNWGKWKNSILFFHNK